MRKKSFVPTDFLYEGCVIPCAQMSLVFLQDFSSRFPPFPVKIHPQTKGSKAGGTPVWEPSPLGDKAAFSNENPLRLHALLSSAGEVMNESP